ncbi:HU family DNA-binding protein [Candidatus Falkowbacteria bacterium]|nr:HU family DNA-binding protein [Candidatus Falkowbacteria bacterium]
MNKATLIDTLAAKANLSKKQVEDLLDAFIQATMDTIKQGGEVTLTGFGTFSARVRKGREGINPRTKAAISIPPTLVVKFKAGKVLKDTLKDHQHSAGAKPAPVPIAPITPPPAPAAPSA